MKRYAFPLNLALLFAFTGLFNPVLAHELQPGTLQLQQLTSERYELIWRAPIYYGKPHPAQLQLPSNWQTIGKPTTRRLSDSHLYHRVVSVPGGDIDGATIRFSGLEATITDVFVRVSWLNGAIPRTRPVFSGWSRPIIRFSSSTCRTICWIVRALKH